MSTKTKIFITGATGYIGGSVLERLQSHPDTSSFEITAIVRSAQKAEGFKKFGVNAVVGSFSDAQLLEDLTAAADVVVDTANADDLEAAKIMLRGSKRKFQETGRPPIFIHTSGTGVLNDNAAGLKATDVVWDDANPNQIEQLPPTASHRDVDLEVIQADKEGYVRTYIVAPATVYGIASGKFVDAGLQNKHSIQIPALISASVDRGQAGMIGKGVNIWPNVDINDVADLYIDLYNAIKANPDAVGHGRDGFYFGLNGEHTLYDVSKELGRVLVALGKSSKQEPTTFTKKEVDKYFNGSNYIGGNSRGLANHSKAIGWRPTKTTKDFLASIKPEVEEVLRTNYKTPVLFPRAFEFLYTSSLLIQHGREG
ncbi:NAD(P)-binding protein [Macrolepiota fuliginosa MF-IS2]|uniref:NAD(P)-binding protein n=1 Tax=Macrolepiota fuliginosa MF-IS2 TaxID=1400762 RepID=A0A9P6C5F2_9AGAR|nr:NAD(P)-binding protein [Macrolepiota fuliginosa MF-IS2]